MMPDILHTVLRLVAYCIPPEWPKRVLAYEGEIDDSLPLRTDNIYIRPAPLHISHVSNGTSSHKLERTLAALVFCAPIAENTCSPRHIRSLVGNWWATGGQLSRGLLCI